MEQADWQESGRAYVGIHELIASLPQLRHLWVNERVLAIPSSDNRDDVWAANPFDGESQESIMSRTVASPQWEHSRCAFERLESLRVGFGPLKANWVTEILSHCDRTKLGAFGLDWEWHPESNKPVRAPLSSVAFSGVLMIHLGCVLGADRHPFGVRVVNRPSHPSPVCDALYSN